MADWDTAETVDLDVQSQNSDVQSPNSDVQSPNSDVQSPNSDVQSPNSDVQSPNSDVQSPNSDVQSPNSDVQSQNSDVQSQNSDVQSQNSDVQSQNSDIYANGHHSRESSLSSEMSNNKENQTLDRQTSVLSENSTLDNSSEKELILVEGSRLKEESRTESVYMNDPAIEDTGTHKLEVPPRQPTIPHKSWSGGTAKERAAKSPHAPANIDSIPEESFTIPKDANVSSFSVNQLANFLRCLRVDDKIISHLHRKSVDGKRFSRLSDSELENLNMKNPVIEYFRERSNVKASKKKGPFML